MQFRKYHTTKIRPADKITLYYQIFISILIVLNFSKIECAGLWLALHFLIYFWLTGIQGFFKKPIFKQMIFWSPILIILINFSELHYLIHPIFPHDADTVLIKIDRWLFGVHPTVWLEKITVPALTEYLQLVYSSFYFLPIILLALLLKNRQDAEGDYVIFALIYGFYLSYVGYFLVPAIGPRFTLAHLQTTTLNGLWLTPVIRHTLDTLENIQRDAFPSGHTEITTLTMYYAWKYQRKYFYILAVVGTSLIFSTVYLRYHYVSDVLGGWLLAAFVVLTAKRVYLLLKGNDRPDGIE